MALPFYVQQALEQQRRAAQQRAAQQAKRQKQPAPKVPVVPAPTIAPRAPPPRAPGPAVPQPPAVPRPGIDPRAPLAGVGIGGTTVVGPQIQIPVSTQLPSVGALRPGAFGFGAQPSTGAFPVGPMNVGQGPTGQGFAPFTTDLPTPGPSLIAQAAAQFPGGDAPFGLGATSTGMTPFAALRGFPSIGAALAAGRGQATAALAPPPEGPQFPVGSVREFNGQRFQVVSLTERGTPVYRLIGAPSPAQRLADVTAPGGGPSGGALLRYLDSLTQSQVSVPGFGGPERAREVARFVSALGSTRQVIVDEHGQPRQTRASFETSVFFTEQALRDGRMPRVAAEAVWDVISQRNRWGITGAEILEQAGYTNMGGGLWERKPPLGMPGFGGGSFSSGAMPGTGGFRGLGFPASGRRDFLGLVNWRI